MPLPEMIATSTLFKGGAHRVSSFLCLCVVLGQREDVEFFEFLPPVEKSQLYHERQSNDLATEALDQVSRSRRRPSRCHQVVCDQDAFSLLHRVAMHLDAGST